MRYFPSLLKYQKEQMSFSHRDKKSCYNKNKKEYILDYEDESTVL